MNIPAEYILPYLFSNLIAIAIAFCAWKWPRVGRLLFFLLFAMAGVANTLVVQTAPWVYLDYAQHTFLPFYRDFILGFFSAHTQLLVQLIAIGQAAIAVLMWMKGIWLNLGLLGATVFLVAIAPLGVGSAFPCTLVMALGAVLLLARQRQGYLWYTNGGRLLYGVSPTPS
jgi:hypothetical protein